MFKTRVSGQEAPKTGIRHYRHITAEPDGIQRDAPRKYLNRHAQSRIHRYRGGTIIPKISTATKTGNPTGTENGVDIRDQRTNLDLEKKKLELDKENIALQSVIDKQRAEAERELLRAALERERMQVSSTLEQVKLQSEVLARILPPPAAGSPDGKRRSDTDAAYVTELVGYHAIKRISTEITRSLSTVVGLGNDVRIMIMDNLDYATGDIPFIEVTSQLSVFEVRCRKQVATNKELSDLVVQKDEHGDNEKTPAVKSGTTRLASLAASPFIFPAITTSLPHLPPGTGITGTTADIAGYFGSGYTSKSRSRSLKNEGLIAAVAGSLRSEKRNVYVYNFYSMDTTGPQSKLMNMYAGVLDCSSRLAQSRNRLLYFISKKTGQLTELRVSLQKTEEGMPRAGEDQEVATLRESVRQVTEWLDRANTEVLASDAIHTELGMFIRNITATDTTRPASKLAQAVFREKIHELGITHLLYLGVLSSGGESVTRKWLLGTGTTSYMGGAVVGYVLSRVEGEVLASEILPALYSFGFDPADQRHSPLKQVRFDKQEPKK